MNSGDQMYAINYCIKFQKQGINTKTDLYILLNHQKIHKLYTSQATASYNLDVNNFI